MKTRDRRGHLGIVGIALLLALSVTTLASAASPREVYADYADNGRLDKAYSKSDLQRAKNDAAIQGYGDTTVTGGLGEEIDEQLGVAGQGEGSEGVGAVGQSGGTLPFTGVDLALLTAGAGFLLVMGWGFRRLARPKQ